MWIGYLDCFSGVAGDMLLGACVDLGWPIERLSEVVAKLRLDGVRVRAERVRRHSLAATKVHVEIDPAIGRGHRHLPQILERIERSGLPAAATDRAAEAFRRLAEAEARVHGIEPRRVHFHEVGADDALVDIVGTCCACCDLGIDTFVCSPVPVGSGTVQCDHGRMPVPAPATAALLEGVPLAACDEPGELTTPTGAALVRTLASRFGPLPAMRLERIGTGAGSREGQTRPNILRLLLGEAAGEGLQIEPVSVLETQVDDTTGQSVGHLMQLLREKGALDAFWMPISMKKERPGVLICALTRPDDAAALARWIMRETGTLGVRVRTDARWVLPRDVQTVRTRFGPIRVKLARLDEAVVRVWPEYDDCAAAARRADVPLRVVQDEVLRVWHSEHGAAGGC